MLDPARLRGGPCSGTLSFTCANEALNGERKEHALIQNVVYYTMIDTGKKIAEEAHLLAEVPKVPGRVLAIQELDARDGVTGKS